MSQLFRLKSLDALLGESEESQRLKRTLGPVQLTALGIGAIIGAGIFSTVGTAASGGGLVVASNDTAYRFATSI